MARLIDKDKFIKDMFALYLDAKWSPHDVHFSLLDVTANIDSPEYEVEAIPIEFLKKQAQKAIGFSSTGNDSISVKNGMLEVVSGYIFAQTIATIIEEWREENGKAN